MFRELCDKEYLLLDDWLVVATQGLSEESAVRVSEEIQEHYEQSVVALIAEGFRPGGAELETIKRLGSPYRARREYKREYPTLRDMNRFERYLGELDYVRGLGVRLHWREVLCGMFLLLAATLYFLVGAYEPPWMIIAQALVIGIDTFAVRVAVHVTNRRGIRQGYGVYLCTLFLVCWPIVVYFGLFYYTSGFLFIFVMLALVLSIHTFRTLQMWRKVKPFLRE